jgi:hypothetical protein
MKREPKFMQRCCECKKIIWSFDYADPDKCKSCFLHPRKPIELKVEVSYKPDPTYDFENNTPEVHVWMV